MTSNDTDILDEFLSYPSICEIEEMDELAIQKWISIMNFKKLLTKMFSSAKSHICATNSSKRSYKLVNNCIVVTELKAY